MTTSFYILPPRPEDIFHYGIKRKSGRYPWGSGERPFQGTNKSKNTFSKVNKTVSNENGYVDTRYTIKDRNGHIISEARCYDFGINNFDWVLLADVETNKDYRGNGLATQIINEAYSDVTNNGLKKKGMYLFVKDDNNLAISLYKKLDFDLIDTYKLDDGRYLIMGKGKADRNQFKGMSFS